MAINSHVFGYGRTTNRNVLKIRFSFPLSSKVKYEAYDNTKAKSVFPSIGNALTTNNHIFIGYQGQSAIGLVDTTNGAPPNANWMPITPNANTATANLLKGTTNYVTQHGANIGANGSIRFNMLVRVPASFQTSHNMGFDLLARYTFTSTTPVIKWKFNKLEAGGTEGSPVWTWATPFSTGKVGLVHVNKGIATRNQAYLLSIPAVGTFSAASLMVLKDLTP